MLKEEIKNKIKDYPNFPKEGIVFKDILPIFENPDLFHRIINSMSSHAMFAKTEAIIAIDARGFLLGSAIAFKTSKPLVLARKPGKLPGKIITGEYDLEYGRNSLSIQKNALNSFNRFVIVDDLLATGGTVGCVSDLLTKNRKQVIGLSVLVELEFLNARSKLNFPISAEISFD